ncbi:MAG: hypothetical protein QNJ38_07905 [Prochloraceae cyanobacterium]|nr:hypothetical protein [Prochloraceae cyanobacterium]
MEEWQKDFLATIELVTIECEALFKNVNQLLEDLVEEGKESLDDAIGDFENIIIAEIESFFDSLAPEDLNREYFGLGVQDLEEDIDLYLNPKVEPTLERHPACIGCNNYHGRVYGGNLLVCAIHPYGWLDENCPDRCENSLN